MWWLVVFRTTSAWVQQPRVLLRTAVYSNIPDWDAIQPEEVAKAKRSKQVRETMKQLREYKQQGRRYDGERLEEVTVKDDEAGFSQLMDDAEAFLGTSGVGGNWVPPPADDEMMRPTVATWGRFPRPKDISKAYGGGRRIGVGANVYVNETLEAERREATRAKLERYRAKSGKDQRIVDEHKTEIEEAIDLAKRAMLKGVSSKGVDALTSVEEYCTARTQLGATALLELALCCEAVGDTRRAQELYATLKRSPIREVQKRAQQLDYGFEAAEFLGVGSYEGSEASRLARGAFQFDFSDVVKSGKVYAQTTPSYSTGPPLISRNAEPYDVLRRAAVMGETFGNADRVAQALDAIAAQPRENDVVEEAIDRLDGKWTVVFLKSDNDAAYQREVELAVDAATRQISRRLPALVGTVDWRGLADRAAPNASTVVARRESLWPAPLSPFYDIRWQADIRFLDDSFCVLRVSPNDLLLCTRQRRPPKFRQKELPDGGLSSWFTF